MVLIDAVRCGPYIGLAEKTAAYVLAAGPKDLNFVMNKLDGKAHGVEL